jgi:hypothetical protein
MSGQASYTVDLTLPFAAGVLAVNPLTATTNALGITNTSEWAHAERGSGAFRGGMLSMAALNAVYVYLSPATTTALAYHGGGLAGVNCARSGLSSHSCQWGAFTSIVGAHSILGNWFDMPSARSFFNVLSTLMGGAPISDKRAV